MDNDVVLKLAAFRLLEEWIEIAVDESEEVRVLDTARFFFRRKKDLPKRYGADAVAAAHAFAESRSTVGSLGSSEAYAALVQVPGIDPGEATLFAATVSLSGYLLVSGDKVSLKALQKVPSCGTIRDGLRGRVISLEQVLLILIRQENFSVIREKIVGREKVDKVVQVAFGLGLETTAEKAIEALEHYLLDLRRETGDLLIAQVELEKFLAP